MVSYQHSALKGRRRDRRCLNPFSHRGSVTASLMEVVQVRRDTDDLAVETICPRDSLLFITCLLRLQAPTASGNLLPLLLQATEEP